MLRRITCLSIVFFTLASPLVGMRASGIQQNSDDCEVYVLDQRDNTKLLSKKFTTEIGEEVLTTKTYPLPGTKLIITASVYYTDESMASKAGSDSMQLGIVVSKRALKDALMSLNASVAEVTLNTLDTVRTEKGVRLGKTNLSVGLICSRGKR